MNAACALPDRRGSVAVKSSSHRRLVAEPSSSRRRVVADSSLKIWLVGKRPFLNLHDAEIFAATLAEFRNSPVRIDVISVDPASRQTVKRVVARLRKGR